MNEYISILRATKERLFERGWQKRTYGVPGGPNCLAGAIHYTSGPSALKLDIRNLLDCLITDGNMVLFNDHEDTSFDDIVDLIDLAIKTLEAQ